MPWEQTDPMNQRTEFVLKAMQTDNFRALCQEYGISAKTGYKWRNEIWTVDFKGWWYGGGGGRGEPLTVRDQFSRYVLDVRALADARSETVRASFERLFEKHGLPQAIRSDNGAPFAHTRALLG